MNVLSNKQLQDELSSLGGWVFKNNAITKSYSFDSYIDGIEFVNRLAEKAEEVNHHPDIQVGWCTVSVTFTSHDKGGVTAACVGMALLRMIRGVSLQLVLVWLKLRKNYLI